MIYGPSGGGKSSFVKAGLIPLLDRARVRPIALEATPSGTEELLLSELRRVVPQLPRECNLPDAVALLRDDPHIRPREKLLLVFDQFEQWLQGRPIEPSAELVRALRQCDGRRVQALLLVRDDFWMALTRLLRAVEVPLVEGANGAAVELFDGRHTRKVLEEFGRSLGQLPPGELPAGSEGDVFLDRAVQDLIGPDGRVIPVRLSLFVEVVRNRPWTIHTLRALGGMEGIGVKFLEEAFDSPLAAPAHRVHRRAATAVLQLLLPAPMEVLRGSPRSGCELREAAGYAEQPGDFADLLQVLDHELRLITPVDDTRAETGAPLTTRPPRPARRIAILFHRTTAKRLMGSGSSGRCHPVGTAEKSRATSARERKEPTTFWHPGNVGGPFRRGIRHPPSPIPHLPSGICHLPFLLPHSPFPIPRSAFSIERKGPTTFWHPGDVGGPFPRQMPSPRF